MPYDFKTHFCSRNKCCIIRLDLSIVSVEKSTFGGERNQICPDQPRPLTPTAFRMELNIQDVLIVAPFTAMHWWIPAYYYRPFHIPQVHIVLAGLMIKEHYNLHPGVKSTFPALSPSGVLKAKTGIKLLNYEEYIRTFKPANHLLV